MRLWWQTMQKLTKACAFEHCETRILHLVCTRRKAGVSVVAARLRCQRLDKHPAGWHPTPLFPIFGHAKLS